jgi:hypothetical protein
MKLLGLMRIFDHHPRSIIYYYFYYEEESSSQPSNGNPMAILFKAARARHMDCSSWGFKVSQLCFSPKLLTARHLASMQGPCTIHVVEQSMAFGWPL